MKKLMITAAALTAALVLSADTYTPSTVPSGLSQSDVTPGEVNYQGLLRNPANGDEYKDGIYHLECRLYTQASGGTPIWGASYSVYVKKGYFNVMLGASDGATLGYTYGATELWKALWYKTGTRELYLGVTPRENADGNALVSPTEITPRQKLLTAPFAFRAQKAQFADAAPGNFKIGGNLEVSGNVTVANGKSLTLKNVSASDSEVKIGSNRSSPSKTTVQGATVTIEAGSGLNVNSHGNANVTMDTGKLLSVNGGNVEIENTSTDIHSTSGLYMDGGSVLSIAGDAMRGTGQFRWNTEGRNDLAASSYRAPIVFRKVQVTVNKNSAGSSTSVASLLPDMGDVTRKYVWGAVGFSAAYAVDSVAVIRGVNTDRSYVVVNFTDICPQSTTVEVRLIGVIQKWTDQVD